MDFVALPRLEGFLDNVPAVARGVNQRIAASRAGTALQDSFQCGKVVIVFAETQVVYEQNELQRLPRQFIQQTRQQVQAAFVQLDQPDSFIPQLVGHGLHRRRFAGPGITIQQDIGSLCTIGQGLCVVQHFLLLALVAHQI